MGLGIRLFGFNFVGTFELGISRLARPCSSTLYLVRMRGGRLWQIPEPGRPRREGTKRPSHRITDEALLASSNARSQRRCRRSAHRAFRPGGVGGKKMNSIIWGR